MQQAFSGVRRGASSSLRYARCRLSVVGCHLSVPRALCSRVVERPRTTDNRQRAKRLRKPWELLEIRLALFDVGVAPLLCFLGEVIEQGGVAAEVEKAELPVAVCVHGRLEEAQG